jgi:diketogulonate reductase-like aldo/keto reductase
MQNVILNNGVKMPILGFGVFQIGLPEVVRRLSSRKLDI